MNRRIDRFVERLAFAAAMTGGAVLIAVMIMTVISITGRGFVFAGLGPIPGDFELVESGTAFAVFAFLSWCQVRRGHVTVDMFLGKAGPRVNAAIDMISNAVLTVVAAIILWRLFAGMLDKRSYSETTFILQYPVWWSYLASCAGAAIFTVVSLWSTWRSWRELRRGEPLSDAISAGGNKA